MNHKLSKIEQRVKYCPFCGATVSRRKVRKDSLICDNCNLIIDLEDEYGDLELTEFPQLNLFDKGRLG